MQLSEMKKAMKGVFVVQTTPFNKDGSLDLEGMRANTRWLIERMAGKDFTLVPVGSTGEFYAMSDEECQAVIKVVVEEAKGKLRVIAGTGRAGTRETIKICQYAESVGADGVMVILPYYHIPEEEGMYLHYKQVAESVNIGIMIYNNPAAAGCWINPPLMARLSQIPNIIAVKENTTSINAYYLMQKTVDPKDTTILGGLAERMFSFQAVYGCPGFISYAANFAPELSYSLYEAAVARDFKRVTELINLVDPLFGFASKVTANHGPSTAVTGSDAEPMMFISVTKAAMDILGLRGGEVRLPLTGLNDKERAELGNILKAIKMA
jgi:4-hydroxy-tetrahydrodipicolinate synthase